MSPNDTLRYPKRLIEVDLPIARISAHARREKSINHGHISTLHIWWARRPLPACRAVICAALWPDPVDVLCPQKFRNDSFQILAQLKYQVEHGLISPDSRAAEKAISQMSFAKEVNAHLDLRKSLLDFIAEFANWDLSTNALFLEASRALTQSAHETLGGEPGTHPFVFDPFSGRGSISLEAIRIGANALASDINPIAVLINKAVLEYIPKYGKKLSDDVLKWGEWIRREAEKEIGQYYPLDPDGSIPLGYLWARTISCEGPGCGITIPLIRNLQLTKTGQKFHLKLEVVNKVVNVSVHCGVTQSLGTVKNGGAICPKCNYATPAKAVKLQLAKKRGGSDDPQLLAVYIERNGSRLFRNINPNDLVVSSNAADRLNRSLLPTDLINPIRPYANSRGLSAVTRIGITSFGDLYTARQAMAIEVFQKHTLTAPIIDPDKDYVRAVITLIHFAVSRFVFQNCSISRWNASRSTIEGAFGKQALQVVWDFAEANPFSNGSANWNNALDWVVKVIEANKCHVGSAIVVQSPAQDQVLPNDSATMLFTDPPYFAAIPYADLSNVFYVWERELLRAHYPDLYRDGLIDQSREIVVTNANLGPNNEQKSPEFFENEMSIALRSCRLTLSPSGIGVIVFADSSTSSWEAIIGAIISAGWIVTSSWPIDTEMTNRTQAQGAASLQSSVHIICRPREFGDGTLQNDEIGDWRDVLSELPLRIHEWMPRLASEGVVGADAIFACLGPALEVFSRYSRVEKASGEQVTLKEYLEHVWAAVSNEALSMIFKDADASGLEPDARLTAMWLWTLGATKAGSTESTEPDGEEPADSDDDDGEKTPKGKVTGFSLEYDAARKIAQGLGIHLEKAPSVVEVKGDQARLLPVGERTRYLFGKEAVDPTQAPKRRKKQEKQLDMFAALEMADAAEDLERPDLKAPSPGDSVLDRVHQAMILFGAGRAEALKRFLVEDGVGKDPRFWKLAQSLSALYPAQIEEKRWVDGVLARKKSFGY